MNFHSLKIVAESQKSGKNSQENIHLGRQHVLGGRGVPICRWSKGHSTLASKFPFMDSLKILWRATN